MLITMLGLAAMAAEIKAAPVKAVPLRDPAAEAWSAATETTIPLMAQNVAYPKNMAPSVSAVRVRALVDPSWVAVRLEWDDKTRDEMVEVDEFTDAVAIELPLAQNANPMMGQAGGPVYIAHWKAIWQKDLEEGHSDVQDYHPGYWSDGYPFVRDDHPYPLETSFEGTDAQRYFAGTSAGNPISALDRLWPVEELTAEGFGSLASQQWQDARGWGAYADGKWVVVLAVPRVSQDPGNPAFATKTNIAFAVWDGDKNNVGGRKHWTMFNDLVIPEGP